MGLLQLAGQPAQATYDHPFSWDDMASLDLNSVFKSRYGSEENLLNPEVSKENLELALWDKESRISPEFHVPQALSHSVLFWLKIYTEFTTQQVVLFDEHHPELIYEVLDFRPLAKKARNLIAYEVTLKQKVQSILRAYRLAFAKLSKNPKPKKPSPLEAKILATIAQTKHKHPMSHYARSLRNQLGQRDNVIKGLLAAELFFPKMEEIFSAIGVPKELTRISLVESSFNLKAVSSAGAVGVWQFLERSGLEYLVIDKFLGIDERLSPLKGAVAAAKLLKRNHRILKSWPLAITSYNHGLRSFRRLANVVKPEHSVRLYFQPCPRHRSLGWASRNYYSEFLALLHAEKYRNLFYGTSPIQPLRPMAFYRLEKNQTPLSISQERGISLREFIFLNPDIKRLKHKLQKGFWVALPIQDDYLALMIKRKIALKVGANDVDDSRGRKNQL